VNDHLPLFAGVMKKSGLSLKNSVPGKELFGKGGFFSWYAKNFSMLNLVCPVYQTNDVKK
jgi:hypothetical protein